MPVGSSSVRRLEPHDSHAISMSPIYIQLLLEQASRERRLIEENKLKKLDDAEEKKIILVSWWAEVSFNKSYRELHLSDLS